MIQPLDDRSSDNCNNYCTPSGILLLSSHTKQRENDMRYTAKQLQSGEYAVCFGRKYYPHSIGTKEYATIEALKMTGHWHQEQLDKCQAGLEKLGAVSDSDPTGWLA